MSTGRVCEKHNEWCADGVCKWCPATDAVDAAWAREWACDITFTTPFSNATSVLYDPGKDEEAQAMAIMVGDDLSKSPPSGRLLRATRVKK